MITAANTDLQPLWTRGLRLLQPHVPRATLIEVVQRTAIEAWPQRYGEAVTWSLRSGGTYILHINPEVLDWYEVELDEVMLFAAAMSSLYVAGNLRHVWQRTEIPSEALSLCRQVSCSPTDTGSPSERWRLMAVRGISVSDETLRRFPTECRVCKRFVNSDEPRSDSHSLCRVYVKTVMIPQLQQIREAEKVLAAGGLDK